MVEFGWLDIGKYVVAMAQFQFLSYKTSDRNEKERTHLDWSLVSYSNFLTLTSMQPDDL